MMISSTILRYLFLLPLFVIGVITSYSDIKYGKIKNIHLFYGFLYILFLYSFLTVYSYFVLNRIDNLRYLVELLLNSSITLLVGYLLWHFNLWAAGDAKLFVIYSLLIPLEFYSKNYIPYFPSATLLIDTFFFICFFFLFKVLGKIAKLCLNKLQKITIKSKRNITLYSLKNYFSKINYKDLYKNLKNAILKIGKFFLIITCSLITLQYLRMKTDIIVLKLLSNLFLVYLFFFILQMFFLRTFLKNKTFSIFIILSGLFCALAFIISNKVAILIGTIKISLLLLIFVGCGMQLVYLFIEKYEIKKVRVKNLYVGSFITTRSLSEIKNKIKDPPPINNFNLIGSDGLNKLQVQAIQALFEDDPEKELYIYETFLFAPFMFLAFIFSFLTKTSILSLFSYLSNLIR